MASEKSPSLAAKLALGLFGVLILVGIIVGIVVAVSNDDDDGSSGNSSESTYVNEDGLIETSLGLIQGNVLTGPTPDDSSTWVYEFLGVRFGQEINSTNRFQPARIYNTSFDLNSTYDATDYGAACPQEIGEFTIDFFGSTDEDCLFLNIWTPNLPESSALDSDVDIDNSIELLPVMLFIHGGSWTSGSGKFYDGIEFVRTGGYEVVYVSINYRLGILGFLQTQELYDEGASGAYGMEWPSYGGMNGVYDQIVAIRWVRQMISSFGGDPERITVFGESAGALSISAMLVSDLVLEQDPSDSSISYSIFDQVILQSGPSAGPWGPWDMSFGLQLNEDVLTDASGTGVPYNLSELRSMTTDELINDVQGGNVADGNWFASVDGHVITDSVLTLFASATAINADRVVWGFNTFDAVAAPPFDNGDAPPTDESELEARLMEYINDTGVVSQLINDYYPLEDFNGYDVGDDSYARTNASFAWYGINSDLCIQCPTFYMADTVDSMSSIEQYMFEFSTADEPFYAAHAAELFFLFSKDNFFIALVSGYTYSEELSATMISAWNNFGILDSEGQSLSFTVAAEDGEGTSLEWYPYGQNQTVLALDDNVRNKINYGSLYRNGACQFWNDNVDYAIRFSMCYNGVL